MKERIAIEEENVRKSLAYAHERLDMISSLTTISSAGQVFAWESQIQFFGRKVMRDRCPSCGCPVGELHEPFCDRELCPFCGDFLTTCECIFEVLSLTPEEREIVERYDDDSVEPLRRIVVR